VSDESDVGGVWLIDMGPGDGLEVRRTEVARSLRERNSRVASERPLPPAKPRVDGSDGLEVRRTEVARSLRERNSRVTSERPLPPAKPQRGR
jgi:hypothetical protein